MPTDLHSYVELGFPISCSETVANIKEGVKEKVQDEVNRQGHHHFSVSSSIFSFRPLDIFPSHLFRWLLRCLSPATAAPIQKGVIYFRFVVRLSTLDGDDDD